MSATFKNAKKKMAQQELRKIMSEHKNNKLQKPTKKIDSPLAKYNEAGQLTCILCKSVVRSEAVWTVHINAKLHKENVDYAKKLKERTNNFSTVPKRPLSPTETTSTKRLKGILKNSKSNDVENEDVGDKVPDDFFDNNGNDQQIIKLTATVSNDEKMEVDEMDNKGETLPEGFFDDPKLDAKARNIEYKDPIEEEWDRFQKEIREADHLSAAIIAEDQEEATNERQLDEIDEQMKNWSRVLILEKKKVEVISVVNKDNNTAMIEESTSTDEDEFDEYLDWRSKKSFH